MVGFDGSTATKLDKLALYLTNQQILTFLALARNDRLFARFVGIG